MINSVRTMWKAPLLLAGMFAVVLLYRGDEAREILLNKSRAQDSVTESVDRWKTDYMALQSAVKQWESNYRPESQIQDQLTLLRAINIEQYGLSYDPDKVTLEAPENLKYEGQPIGLFKVCIASGLNSRALEVTAPSYAELFKGVKALAARPDLYVGIINIKGDKVSPTAYLQHFCILLRKGHDGHGN